MFWRRLFGLIGIHFGEVKHEGTGTGRLTLIHILLGMIPAVVIGLVLHDQIKTLFNPINVMYALVVGGLLLLAAEFLKPKQPKSVGVDDITYRQAFMIGCFQCLALWPGFSRSGATISGGMLMGVSRYAASEFSFILAVPMMMGATGLDLYKSLGFLSMADFPMFAVGFYHCLCRRDDCDQSVPGADQTHLFRIVCGLPLYRSDCGLHAVHVNPTRPGHWPR